jgi:hypothetical protein
MRQHLTIASRAIYSFTAYTVETRVFAQAGSFPPMLKDLKSMAQKAEKQKSARQ